MAHDKNTVIVVGGNGYIGSRMCEQAILNGFNVISISRSGVKPSWLSTSVWAEKVQWAKGDALEIDSMRPYFNSNSIRAVISCVGCFHWRNSVMQKICGDTNINACNLAKECNIDRFVFVSSWRPSHLLGKWNPCRLITIPGYFGGKLRAEECVESNYGDHGVSFRPGMVLGVRHISESKSVPLEGIGKVYSLVMPVVHVDELAKAAIRFVKSCKPNTDQHIVQNADIIDFYCTDKVIDATSQF
eukprot:593457_1